MWLLFALLNPVADAFRSVFAKKASEDYNPFIIAWANNFIPVIIFFPFLFFIDIQINTKFVLGFTGTWLINIVTTILYMKAIKEGDISVVMPMLSFTPVFLLVTSPLIVGEFPNKYGVAGVLLVVAGSYILHSESKDDFWAPFKSIITQKGTRLMLLVAFLFSFSSNFDKVAIQNSSVMQHIVFANIFLFTSFTVINIFKKNNLKLKEGNEKGRKNLLMISLFTASMFVFHLFAISMTFVVYVIALKRLSGLISVVLGKIFFNERNIKSRLTGAFVMSIGVFLIVFLG